MAPRWVEAKSLKTNKLTSRRKQTLEITLPRLHPDTFEDCCEFLRPDEILDHFASYHDFSLRNMAWAIQNGTDLATLQRYLDNFTPAKIAEELNGSVTVAPGGPIYPILYFAAERNSPGLVRLLCNAGAQPSQDMSPLGLDVKLPLLAFAVLNAELPVLDTTNTVISLLAMGANPSQIPRDMWEQYLELPAKDVPEQTKAKGLSDLWCVAELREALCRNLNLMQRYALWKADNTNPQPPVSREIAKVHSITPVFEIIYHLIGQRTAAQETVHCIMDHVIFGDTVPLVLLFAGPSGHGKTELARKMGNLLTLKIHTVDFAEMKHETDMFGPKKPYLGYDEGSPLNKFLWENGGEKCVVFLDELEKTSEEVRNAMLKLFETGFYKDRRDDKPIDCSRVIWILAANLGCNLIQRFWAQNLKDRTEEDQKQVALTNFNRMLKDEIISDLGAPFTGSLTRIIPFMPFNTGEQAVATFKFMRDLWNNVRKPINIESKQFPRHIFIHYNDDGAIAAHLAKHNYDTETGARPLERAVKREIRGKLSRAFLGLESMVKNEMNEGPLQKYEVRLVTVEKDVNEISVEIKGTKQIRSSS